MTTTNAPDLEAVKRTQQQTWSSGDYSMVAARIQFVAEQLVESAELRAGWRVLDVATGSGNAAIAAARSGTSVVGVDYVADLLTDGRARAAAEGLDVQFLEGDAENLPVGDGEFDAVLSVFGSMFTPDHARAAREIARACRPGGTIALASWTPESFVAEMFRTISHYAPPPAGIESPMLWGNEAHLRDIFGASITDLHSQVRVCTFRFETAEAFVTFFRRFYGPTLRAFGRVDAAAQAGLTGALAQLANDADIWNDGASIAIRSHYLETIARRA